MLKCIKCEDLTPPRFNATYCDVCKPAGDPNHTYLYSTSIPSFLYEPTPIYFDHVRGASIKKEDENPSYTFKDRKSVYISHLMDISTTPLDQTFALASSGNQAFSLAKYLPRTAREFTYLYLPSNISLKKLQALRKLYDDITITDDILSTEELTRFEPDRWNITNGMDPIGASAFYSMGLELEPYNFDNILVPCGSGELVTALSIYFNILRKKNMKIVAIRCNYDEAESIKTDFLPTKPLLENVENISICLYTLEENRKRTEWFAKLYRCEFSSAIVFTAFEDLKLKGKTCLILTGGLKPENG